MVYKLLKALYGLKQVPRLWYEKLFNFFLKNLYLQQIHANHKIFVSLLGINGLIVSRFIDDIKIIGAKNSRVIS